jgi:acetyl-CoA synthetase
MLHLLIHDNWWQTETGGIMISNYSAMDIRPGSMGRPLPGIEPAIVHRLEGGKVEVETRPNVEGELALKPGWPSMFRTYLNDEDRYKKCFVDGWYITGDLAERDEDGYYWFIGRADDIIKTAGHMVGPFEVESALLEHPAVAEVGVIGKPDPVIGELVKAFVALKPGFNPSDDCAWSCKALDASNWARQWLPKRSNSWNTSRRRAAARSCAACSKPASLGCPRVIRPHWRRQNEYKNCDERKKG